MKIVSTAKRMLRGEVSVQTAALEAMRRFHVLRTRWRERAQFNELDRQPARLREEFARIRSADLLAHFQSRVRPKFFPGFDNPALTGRLQLEIFPAETNLLLHQAHRIAEDHCWSLLGFGEKCFGKEQIHWNRDPLSGFEWPLDYHADIDLMRQDGSDARVVWELNRLAQLVSLGRAYAITNNEQFSEEFFRQLTSWCTQNPAVRGVNWSCAMEVALRIMNLLAAFTLFLHAPQMNPETLKELLRIFDQHGAHIKRNLEFSYLATSNHYLSDVVGLLWIGLMLPELEAAKEWRDFGLTELLNEMDKQVLPDGADHEAATGYHRLTLELFLYSFVLCHINDIDIAERYWQKLHAMVDYVSAYLRPDGYAPLIGDSDSGQVLPIVRRRGDDHAYVLALSAAVFGDPQFKIPDSIEPEELLWIVGEQGRRDYQALPESEAPQTQAFTDAGTYILRDHDMYLLFNASGSGLSGRGSHGHNDALSIEVSACGTAFIVDPGSYVYTADLKARHSFRSTAYHSTVEVDGVEQNTTNEAMPFVIGNEAQPRVLGWETNSEFDYVVAEHYGYRRLSQPVTHRRSVRFDKPKRNWLVEDELTGPGTHELSFRFHFAPGLETKIRPDGIVEVCDKMNGVRLLIRGIALAVEPELESRYSARDYGAKEPTATACWSVRTALPFTAKFALVPLRSDERDSERVR